MNPLGAQKNERGTAPTQVNSLVSDDESPSVVSVRPVKDPIDPKSYFTDTSDIEERLDSSRVGGPTNPQAKSNPTLLILHHRMQTPKVITILLGIKQERIWNTQNPIASGRALLRKYSTSNRPIILPIGYSAIALSEGLMHAVLKTISG